jgi:hypothetical protein
LWRRSYEEMLEYKSGMSIWGLSGVKVEVSFKLVRGVCRVGCREEEYSLVVESELGGRKLGCMHGEC